MATKGEKGFFDEWPEWSKPTLALAVIILLGGAWIGVPSLMTWNLIQQSIQQGVAVNYQPITTVLVAMTTATIAGVFLFMTLRIDRGTRLKAESVAKREIEKRTEEIDEKTEDALSAAETKMKKSVQNAETKVTAFVQDAETKVTAFVQDEVPNAIEERIEMHVTEAALQKHVEAILMTDVRVKSIKRYAKLPAANLDSATLERVAGHLSETTKAWRRLVQEERRARRKAALRAFFSKFKRSSEDG